LGDKGPENYKVSRRKFYLPQGETSKINFFFKNVIMVPTLRGQIKKLLFLKAFKSSILIIFEKIERAFKKAPITPKKIRKNQIRPSNQKSINLSILK
jgi:hypothetical protein